MDFASPRLDVQLSPKRPVTEEERAERVVAIKESIAEKKHEEEEHRKMSVMEARKEKFMATMFALANAERDVAVPFNAPDFHPAYVYGHHLDKAMNIDHKRLEQYACKHEEVSRPAVGIVVHRQGDDSHEVDGNCPCSSTWRRCTHRLIFLLVDADSDIGEMIFAGPEPEGAIKKARYEYEDAEVVEVVRLTARQKLALHGVGMFAISISLFLYPDFTSVYCDVPKGIPSRPYTKPMDPIDRFPRYKWVSKGKVQDLKRRKQDVYARGYRPYHPQNDLATIDEYENEELSELDSTRSSPVIQTPVLEIFGEVEVEVVVDGFGPPYEEKVRVVDCQGGH